MAETCSNPLCGNPVVTHPKALHPRRFCSDPCRLDFWAIKRVSKLLYPLGKDRCWEEIEIQEGCPRILDAIVKGGNPLTNEEMAQQTGIQCEIVDRAIERLLERGELRLTPEQPEVENRGSPGKAGGEIVNPGAIVSEEYRIT